MSTEPRGYSKVSQARSGRMILIAATLLSGTLSYEARAQNRDPKAEELAHTVMGAMGGQEAWNNTQFVRFDFIVASGDGSVRPGRSHLWDKWTGRYRLEQTTEDGKRQVVLLNTNDKTGSVYLDGEKLDDDAAADPLQKAYGAFINDTYWLSMPWKWLDPGVNLAYVGEKEKDGTTYEVVQLTFGNVGLTPGDKYHAYVDPDSRLMTYWEYTLQSDRTGAWNWEYGDYKGVKLASNHTNAEGTSINMGDVAVFNQVDENFFTDPSKSLAELK